MKYVYIYIYVNHWIYLLNSIYTLVTNFFFLYIQHTHKNLLCGIDIDNTIL